MYAEIVNTLVLSLGPVFLQKVLDLVHQSWLLDELQGLEMYVYIRLFIWKTCVSIMFYRETWFSIVHLFPICAVFILSLFRTALIFRSTVKCTGSV